MAEPIHGPSLDVTEAVGTFFAHFDVCATSKRHWPTWTLSMPWHPGLGLIDAYDAAVVGRKANGRQPWSTPR